MAAIAVEMARLDRSDVQGLVRFGYASLKEGRYFLLRIRDAAEARKWCGSAPVATAEFQDSAPDTVLQVAFTILGLRKLGLPEETLAQFSREFREGMTSDANRSRRLGDVEKNAPDQWLWGYEDMAPDLIVMLFARPGKLVEWSAAVRSESFDQAFELMLDPLDTRDLGGNEHFGFVDGISQPQIDWDFTRDPNQPQIDYTNLSMAGEFVLGYPNEYGKYTTRPLLDPLSPGAQSLPDAEDTPGKKDFGRNGTFMVMRTLKQDAHAFWSYLDGQAAVHQMTREEIGEKMVGRKKDTGNPLASTEDPMPGLGLGPRDNLNVFTFKNDPVGTRCPLGAHIRRANPRNADFPGRPSFWFTRILAKLGLASLALRSDIAASTRFHRLLRRGRSYGGPLLTPDQAIQPDSASEERGLHFACLGANIGRQFEFVQNAWIMSTKFDGLAEESDPLLGNRTQVAGCPATSNFSIPREEGLSRRLEQMPQFITVRGGAYFFLPGISALRYLGRIGDVGAQS
jgi:Dyp-type peroxidase family